MKYPGLRSIARNAAWLGAAQAVTVGARLVYVVLVARLLGPELYGLLAWSQSWYLAFLPVALFGLGQAIVHDMAADHARAPAVAAQALGLRLALTAVAGAACVALAFAFAPDPRAPLLVAVLTLALAARAVNAWAQHLYTAFEVTHFALRQEAAFRALELAAALAALLAGAGPVALAAVHAAAWSAQAAWSLRVVGAQVMPVTVAWRPAAWWPLATLAAPFFLMVASGDWRMHGTLVLFGRYAATPAELSDLAIAMQGLGVLAALPAGLVAAAQPVLTRSAARGDAKDVRFASALQRLAIVGGAAAALAAMALGTPVVTTVFGAQYAGAGRLLGPAIWCLAPLAATVAWPSVVVARGDLRTTALVSIAGAVVLTVALPLLAPRLGAMGALLAAGLGFATVPVGLLAVAVARGWAGWGSELLRPGAAALAGLAGWFAAEPAGGPLAGLAAGWLALGLATLALGVVTAGERAALVAWAARR